MPTTVLLAGATGMLARKIEQERLDDPGGAGDTFPASQQLQCLRNMVSGRDKLDSLDNAQYPGLKYESVEGFLNRSRGEAGR